jgi:hypothetical protein
VIPDEAEALLDPVSDIEGFMLACLVDASTGMVLASRKDQDDISLPTAAAGAADIANVLSQLTGELPVDGLEDVLVTFRRQLYVIRLVSPEPQILLLAILDRDRENWLWRAGKSAPSVRASPHEPDLPVHPRAPADLDGRAGSASGFRAKMRTMGSLRLDDAIEDILITLGNHYHLIRLLKNSRDEQGLFIYLVLQRQKANLALARHNLRRIENDLSV